MNFELTLSQKITLQRQYIRIICNKLSAKPNDHLLQEEHKQAIKDLKQLEKANK